AVGQAVIQLIENSTGIPSCWSRAFGESENFGVFIEFIVVYDGRGPARCTTVLARETQHTHALVGRVPIDADISTIKAETSSATLQSIMETGQDFSSSRRCSREVGEVWRIEASVLCPDRLVQRDDRTLIIAYFVLLAFCINQVELIAIPLSS